MEAIFTLLVVGAVAGWLAGQMMKGRGFGLLGNIAIGIIGAVLGGWLFDLLGLSVTTGLIGAVVTALVGAVVLLALVGLIKRS